MMKEFFTQCQNNLSSLIKKLFKGEIQDEHMIWIKLSIDN